jgi:hypothetical protein
MFLDDQLFFINLQIIIIDVNIVVNYKNFDMYLARYCLKMAWLFGMAWIRTYFKKGKCYLYFKIKNEL